MSTARDERVSLAASWVLARAGEECHSAALFAMSMFPPSFLASYIHLRYIHALVATIGMSSVAVTLVRARIIADWFY